MRRVFPFAILILLMLACATLDSATPAPVNTPTEFSVIIPHPNQTARPAPTMTSTPAQVFSTPVVFPAWVAEFSDPILVSLQSRLPDFQDDFPAICIDENHEWKVCASPEPRLNYQYPLYTLMTPIVRPTLDLQPDLQNGYALRNSGWFYVVPDSYKKLYYAHIDSGVLILRLPEGKENKDLWVYSPHIMSKNFVLEFDLEFDETQPEDGFRFQFDQGKNQSFAFELFKNKTWNFQWGALENRQSRSGVYEYLDLTRVKILVIARGTQCAVYLNDAPLDYFENCRADANQKLTQQAATFHILGAAGHSSALTIDNVKLWDLDK